MHCFFLSVRLARLQCALWDSGKKIILTNRQSAALQAKRAQLDQKTNCVCVCVCVCVLSLIHIYHSTVVKAEAISGKKQFLWKYFISKMILNINLRTWKSCMVLHTDILTANRRLISEYVHYSQLVDSNQLQYNQTLSRVYTQCLCKY